MLQDFPKGGTLADNIFEAVFRADFRFEIELIVFDPAHVGKTACCEICESNGRAHSLLLMITVCLSDCRTLGGSLLWHREFEDPSALLRMYPLHSFSEPYWNVELNDICHVGTPVTLHHALSNGPSKGWATAGVTAGRSTINSELRSRVKKDQTACDHTRSRLPTAGRNMMWMNAHANHAGNPLIFATRESRMANPRPITAMLPLSK
jgi:hypothetical protein